MANTISGTLTTDSVLNVTPAGIICDFVPADNFTTNIPDVAFGYVRGYGTSPSHGSISPDAKILDGILFYKSKLYFTLYLYGTDPIAIGLFSYCTNIFIDPNGKEYIVGKDIPFYSFDSANDASWVPPQETYDAVKANIGKKCKWSISFT